MKLREVPPPDHPREVLATEGRARMSDGECWHRDYPHICQEMSFERGHLWTIGLLESLAEDFEEDGALSAQGNAAACRRAAEILRGLAGEKGGGG